MMAMHGLMLAHTYSSNNDTLLIVVTVQPMSTCILHAQVTGRRWAT
jgi:hypothetical protein